MPDLGDGPQPEGRQDVARKTAVRRSRVRAASALLNLPPSRATGPRRAVSEARSGASFHEGHFKYRLNGAKRAIAIDYLGLPVAVGVTGSRTHDVRAARELLADVLPGASRVTTVMGDRGLRGLAGPLAREHRVETVIKHDPGWPKGPFRPLRPLWKVEAAFSELGRWRRLARSFEGTAASATAWMQVAAVEWLLRDL